MCERSERRKEGKMKREPKKKESLKMTEQEKCQLCLKPRKDVKKGQV